MSGDEISSRRLPTKHQLSAQRRVMEAVGDGAERAGLRATYPRLPTGGVHSSSELLAAEHSLMELGILHEVGNLVVPTEIGRSARDCDPSDFTQIVVLQSLLNAPPLWLGAAAWMGEVRHEFIPDSELANLAEIGLTPDDRDQLLLAAGRRVDATHLKEVGLAGELEVIRSCEATLVDSGRSDLAKHIIHVSLQSDQLGYDIKVPTLANDRLRLEVKTCSTLGDRFEIHLSRNEADYGRRDPTWRVVVCRFTKGAVSIIGWCTFSMIEPLLPTDSQSGGRWSSVEIVLNRYQLNGGLPLSGIHTGDR